jgi:hypothetical protein
MARFNLDDYIDVAERIEQFYAKYPAGKITTQLLNVGGWNGKQTQFIVQAFLYDEQGALLATGLAEESLGGSGANVTSALENAETSAIGRATSNLNFATSKTGARQRATRQEMEKVARGEVKASPQEEIKALLVVKFDNANDRKFWLEAQVERELRGVADLTSEEQTKIINLLKGDK